MVLERSGHEASDALVAQPQFVLLLLQRENGVDEIERRAEANHREVHYFMCSKVWYLADEIEQVVDAGE